MSFENFALYLFLILFNFFFVYKINWIAKKINVYDKPDNLRKIHTTPTPLVGGILIFTNYTIFSLFFLFFDIEILKSSFRISEDITIIFFIISFLFIFLIGFYDDVYSISSKVRILILSLIVYFFVYLIDISQINFLNFIFTEKSFELNRLKIFFSFFCIIILLISCNLYDGINLQSFLFYFINFSFLYYLSQDISILIIIISLIFFGYLNTSGKVFLGDSGVYFLSFILGYYFIIYYNLQHKVIYADQIFIFLLLPVLDSFRVFLLRLLKNKDIFVPDKNHFHHIILKKFGYSKSIIILLFFNLIPIFSYIYFLNPAYTFLVLILLYLLLLFFSKSIKV